LTFLSKTNVTIQICRKTGSFFVLKHQVFKVFAKCFDENMFFNHNIDPSKVQNMEDRKPLSLHIHALAKCKQAKTDLKTFRKQNGNVAEM
jgi:hypothetical protein